MLEIDLKQYCLFFFFKVSWHLGFTLAVVWEVFCTLPSAWQAKLPSLNLDLVPAPNDNLIPFLHPDTESVFSIPPLYGAACDRNQRTHGRMRGCY